MSFDVPNIYRELRKIDGPDAVRQGWTEKVLQQQNFALAVQFLEQSNVVLPGLTLHDAGCGVGDLLKYLQDNKLEPRQYIGSDFTLASVTEAGFRFPSHDFRHIDLTGPILPKVDVTVVMGTLAYHRPRVVERMLANLWEHTTCAMVFNTWWELKANFLYADQIEALRKCVHRFLRGKQWNNRLGTDYGQPTEAIFVVYR